MCGLMSGPAACGDTSISASAANAGRSPASRPAVAQAVARRRFRRFICYAMLAIANGARWIRRCPHGAQSYAGTRHAHGKTGPIFRYRGSLRARLIAAVNWVALAMRWAKCRYLGIPFTQPFALPAVGGAVPLDRAGRPLPDAEAGGSPPARAPAPHHFARDLRLSQADTHMSVFAVRQWPAGSTAGVPGPAGSDFVPGRASRQPEMTSNSSSSMAF